MRSKDGETLYKKVKAKIFARGNQKHFVREWRAPAGKGINEDGVAKWLKSLADAIEKNWPGHEYRMAELGPASFNFIWVREIESEPIPA